MQTFTPKEYMEIDIASNYGHDKESWDYRIQWTKDNLHGLRKVVEMAENKDARNHPFMEEAESPALFYASIKAYLGALEGKPVHHPISLDATASGAQILALLVNCEKSARLCNVINTGNREDLYTGSYAGMRRRMDLPEDIDRSVVKQAIMTFLYGSTAEPKKAFGEGEVLDCFYATMLEDAPGITRLNTDLLSLWDPEALSNNWVLPDNFHVNVKVMGDQVHLCEFLNEPHTILRKVNKPQERGLSIGANIVHSLDGMVVREIVRRCTYDHDHYIELAEMILHSSYARGDKIRTDRTKDRMVMKLWDHYAETGFLSARILTSLDHYNIGLVNVQPILKLLKSMPEKPFPVISVHDCFRVHPNYGNDLRRQYNQILSEIAASDLLQTLVNQVANRQIIVNKEGDIAAQVLEAEYALS